MSYMVHVAFGFQCAVSLSATFPPQFRMEHSTPNPQIRGKGSVKAGKGRKDGMPIPGEDEPMHALVTGPDEVRTIPIHQSHTRVLFFLVLVAALIRIGSLVFGFTPACAGVCRQGCEAYPRSAED